MGVSHTGLPPFLFSFTGQNIKNMLLCSVCCMLLIEAFRLVSGEYNSYFFREVKHNDYSGLCSGGSRFRCHGVTHCYRNQIAEQELIERETTVMGQLHQAAPEIYLPYVDKFLEVCYYLES